MKQSFFVKLTLGILVLIILISKIGTKELISNILNVNIFALITVFLVLIANILLGALNFKILTFPMKKISFFRLLKYSSVSWALGLFVPGKLGEFSLIPLLKKEGIPFGLGTAISLIDKIITLILLSFLSLIGFILFLDIKATLILFIILLVGSGILSFFILSEMGRRLIKRYMLRKFSNHFEGFSKFLFIFLKKHKSLILLDFIITFFKWFLNSLMLYVLFLSYNQSLSLIFVFLISSMLILISLIPITIGGIGIREGAAVFLFSILGVQPEITLSVALLTLFITYLVGALIALYGLKKLNWNTISLKNLKNST